MPIEEGDEDDEEGEDEEDEEEGEDEEEDEEEIEDAEEEDDAPKTKKARLLLLPLHHLLELFTTERTRRRRRRKHKMPYASYAKMLNLAFAICNTMLRTFRGWMLFEPTSCVPRCERCTKRLEQQQQWWTLYVYVCVFRKQVWEMRVNEIFLVGGHGYMYVLDSLS